jgi:hypothetical protein
MINIALLVWGWLLYTWITAGFVNENRSLVFAAMDAGLLSRSHAKDNSMHHVRHLGCTD